MFSFPCSTFSHRDSAIYTFIQKVMHVPWTTLQLNFTFQKCFVNQSSYFKETDINYIVICDFMTEYELPKTLN